MRSKRNKSILVFIIVCCFGCQHNESCELNYIREFSDGREPFFYIRADDTLRRCEYPVDVELWQDTLHLYSQGALRKSQDLIQLKVDSSSSEFKDFLNFSKGKGDRYDVTFSKDGIDYKFKIIIDSKVEWAHNNSAATVFRIPAAYRDLNHLYDIVLIATLENGIIGSNLSGFFESKEYLLAPAGNVLLKERMLSNMEIRRLR